MSDYLLSLIRTVVPVAVGSALTWLAVRFGLVLDEQTSGEVAVVATMLVVAAYYAIVRKLEQRWPTIGRVLLGAGAGKTPVYAPPSSSVTVDDVTHRSPDIP